LASSHLFCSTCSALENMIASCCISNTNQWVTGITKYEAVSGRFNGATDLSEGIKIHICNG
jgi:hypothetical protein